MDRKTTDDEEDPEMTEMATEMVRMAEIQSE